MEIIKYKTSNDNTSPDVCLKLKSSNVWIVLQWDLVCDGAERAELSQSLVLLGQGFGGFIFTGISDKFGRKPVHITSHIFLFLLTISLVVIPGYIGFAIARFFIGAMVEVGLFYTTQKKFWISLYNRLQTHADSERINRSSYNFQRMLPTLPSPISVKTIRSEWHNFNCSKTTFWPKNTKRR